MTDIDDAAYALEAMATIGPLIRRAVKDAPKGQGEIPCPRCHAHGRASTIKFNFEQRPGRGSRRLSYVAWCELDGCIKFSGH